MNKKGWFILSGKDRLLLSLLSISLIVAGILVYEGGPLQNKRLNEIEIFCINKCGKLPSMSASYIENKTIIQCTCVKYIKNPVGYTQAVSVSTVNLYFNASNHQEI